MKNDPLKVVHKLVEERYPTAQAVFWAGSVANQQGTAHSDLDLVIIHDRLPSPYREAFYYLAWPVDVFVNDLASLQRFFEESLVGNGISGLINMLLTGKLITAPNEYSSKAIALAQTYQAKGPASWSPSQIMQERFLITDLLDDIKYPNNNAEQIASTARLYDALLQFYFRAQHKWSASGKTLIRLLQSDKPALATRIEQAFTAVFTRGATTEIDALVTEILAPYGGLLWDGFRAEALPSTTPLNDDEVFAALKAREPIFHHPETYGTTRAAIEAQMSEDFWEVGASGTLYTKEEIITTLLARYQDPHYIDQWEAFDFKLTRIDANHYLITYQLVQELQRRTRRATLWQYQHGSWKIRYHQGTLI